MKIQEIDDKPPTLPINHGVILKLALKDHLDEICRPEVLAELQALHDRHRQAQVLADQSYDEVNTAAAHVARLGGQMAAGEPLTGRLPQDQESLELRAEGIKAVSRAAQEKIGTSAAKIALEILPRAIAVLENWIAQKLAAESEIFQSCGIGHDGSKSFLANVLNATAARLHSQLRNLKANASHRAPPRDLLPFLDLQ